ncbi:a900eebf-6572-4ee1-9d9a-6aace5805f34 [Thermothielavioides terrestris]|uniref:glutamine--tRNA ligase n=1 Tax=Thermothielavioides terrestris TaxID=2587410 RepID=A0A446BMR4_9PEZI|nr:a900eebf-6572-4ee1-9d9a-6aace5805f34 [Thermothielavioides terrestris]
MADAIAEQTAKLQLDGVTGEMVSKNELKRRLQKRAKKAAAISSRDATPTSMPKQTLAGQAVADGKVPASNESVDQDAMFGRGFLAEVYKLRPSKEVTTRFPPEPNGYLHLGHAKAIAINFGFARYHGGKTILRFDDTNPDVEKEEYFVAIEETIRWLGFVPSKITYASDYFQRMYDLAEELIKKEKAYVCHCDEAATKLQRGGEDGSTPRYRCEHADQDVETNLVKFRGMRDGEYAPQTAWLRMKQDMDNPNPQMWDIAAYRIPKNQQPHFRTGTKWRIYPTYDFAHCLCDSFEGVTHSLCTTEFTMSRESYEWLNKLLVEFQPMQREYGRLNLKGTIMSKRDIRSLIESKVVRGWDDPRLYTLGAIRRRGIPPGALLSFIAELGVTTANAFVEIKRFEQSIRRYLERTVPRLMLVLDPVPVVIEDADEQDLDIPLFPKDPRKMGSRRLKLTKRVYIERTDFREVDSEDYFRLAPGKTVGLLHMPYPIKAVSFTKDETTGAVTEIQAAYNKEGEKPKTYIQWVPEGSPGAEVRVYTALFKSDQPASAPGGFMNDIHPQSQTVWPNALIEPGFDEVRRRAPWPEAEGEKSGEVGPEGVRFQGMRVGYFALDSDSTDDKIVLNRIVPLKEDPGKSS